MYFHCVDAMDGMTPELGEAGGQPQISHGGAEWVNTTNLLVAIGNGRYYVELTANVECELGVIQGRYKSANTAETLGTTLQVIVDDPYKDRELTFREQTGTTKCTVEAGSTATVIQFNAMSPPYHDEIGSFDSFIGSIMFFLTGVCAGEIRIVTVFTGEGSGHWVITVATAFSQAPAAGDICLLLPGYSDAIPPVSIQHDSTVIVTDS
jgi:hypothetical protein